MLSRDLFSIVFQQGLGSAEQRHEALFQILLRVHVDFFIYFFLKDADIKWLIAAAFSSPDLASELRWRTSLMFDLRRLAFTLNSSWNVHTRLP